MTSRQEARGFPFIRRRFQLSLVQGRRAEIIDSYLIAIVHNDMKHNQPRG
jgi:hypothetical protein